MVHLTLVQKIVVYAIPIIFAITVHEVAHGWVASKLGDQTAKLAGRLTLNPIKHIDPIGTILLPMVLLLISNFVFGWAKPVPVDWRNLNHPKRDMALVAAAGPGANLVMLIIWAVLARILVLTGAALGNMAAPLMYMAQAGIFINIVLMVLNLIPVPPLDGSRIVSAALPPRWAWRYNLLERWGMVILIVLIATRLLNVILWPPVEMFYKLAMHFVVGK